MSFEFDKKKVLALAALILITVGMGYLIYRMFFKAPSAEQPTAAETTGQQLGTSAPAVPGEAQPSVPTNPELPTALPSAAAVAQFGEGNKIVAVTPVVTAANSGVTLAGDGKNLQYYDKVDGKFYRTDANGNNVLMSDTSFPSAQTVTWAPNKAVAAIEFPDNSKVIYDFDKQKQFTVPSHWTDINFSPDSNQITGKTISPDPNARFLFVARTDGTGASPIEPLGENGDKVQVSWSPNNQVIAFSRTAPATGAADRQGVLLIGKNHENFRQLTVEGLGFEPEWSPQGDKILYSAHNSASGLVPTLWVDGGTSENIGVIKNYLGVNTWAHKCTFTNNNEALCAVPDPDKLPNGIGFAPWLATNTNDTIYKINLQTGFQTVVAKPEGNRTIEQMQVSQDGSTLFMKDQNTGEVLKMKLK